MSEAGIRGEAARSSASARQHARPWYRWYVLGVLLLGYILNFIDRSILAMLTEPIKHALRASDTQMGLLGGVAFALFYTAMGIPVARLADRGVRRNVLAGAIAIWSAMTGVCGFVTSFTQLLLARVGVAVGEAGGSPPSHSMISDLFPQHERATALAVYALGIPVGSMFGALLGGWINAHFDWRTAFMVVGFPGLLLALFVRFGIAEPRRGQVDGRAHDAVAPEAPPVSFVLSYLWTRKSFRYLSLGAAMLAFIGYGLGAWTPAFYQRIHHVDTGTLGVWFFWLGVPAVMSTFFGGWYGDWLGKRDVRWYLWMPAIAAIVGIPLNVFVFLWSNWQQSLLVSIIPGLVGSFWLAPTFSLTQGLVSLRMRAVAASIVLFIVNLIGMGLGPLFTAMLADALKAYTTLGDQSLRAALVIVTFVAIPGAIFYALAARTLKADLANVEAD